MLATDSDVELDPSYLDFLDFGVRCVQCSWRVVGMDIVHVGASGDLPIETVASREGTRSAIVIRDKPPPKSDFPPPTVCKGWATPVMCTSCGTLFGVRGLLRPAALPLWRRWAARQTCPKCREAGVLPFAVEPFAPADVLLMPVLFAVGGAVLTLRLMPTQPIALIVVLMVVVGLACGVGGYLLGLQRWGRGLNKTREWFHKSRCPQCKATGLAHRRGLGHLGCMAHDDPFGDWPIETIEDASSARRAHPTSPTAGPPV